MKSSVTMLVMGTLIISIGLVIVCLVWVHYLWLIPQERVPARPIVHISLMILGMIFALYGGLLAFVIDLRLTFITGALIAVTLILAIFFLYLLSIARMPDQKIAVKPGDPMIEFSAANHRGEIINSKNWRGQRVLLKFYRGHW